MMARYVEVRGVTKVHGRTTALRGVDLDLGPGICGLLGPNGAGKTSLLRILATASAPTAGTVQLLGRDPSDPAQRLAVRRRLGYVPQEVGLYASFSVFDFVDYIAVLKEHADRAARHDEVRRVQAAVDLADERSRKIRKLSGGMRRRVVLAQALLGDPALLVLDEPTVGLDPEQRLRFRQLISRQAEDRCVVLSTHLADDVEALCHRVVVLDHGEVAFSGSPPELAALAEGRVWLAERPDPAARVSWRTGDGRHRHVGEPPPGAELIAPTVHDGYLLLSGSAQREAVA
jgi:ABC-2 type transport system ATP-binding protein